MTKSKIEINPDQMYILFKEEDTYTLRVTCGGIGMFNVELELNSQEVDLYKDQGQRYLNELSLAVSKGYDQEPWKSRLA
jgi:hypothetical protein